MGKTNHPFSGAYGKRFCSATILGFALIAVLARADIYPRQPGVDAVHYVFRLTVGDDSDMIGGETTVTLKFTADGLKEVYLDLTSAVEGKGMTVSSVTSAGTGISIHSSRGRSRLALLRLGTPPRTRSARVVRSRIAARVLPKQAVPR